QQLPRQGYNADLPGPFIPGAEASLIPLTQGAAGLPAQPQPGQLHDEAAHMLVARLADPLLPLALAAVVRRRRQPDQGPQFLAILDRPPGKQLQDQDPRPPHPDGLQTQQPPYLL